MLPNCEIALLAVLYDSTSGRNLQLDWGAGREFGHLMQPCVDKMLITKDNYQELTDKSPRATLPMAPEPFALYLQMHLPASRFYAML